jgi:hypothetical protein
MTKKNNNTGRRTVAPMTPAAFTQPAPTPQPQPNYKTQTFQFEGLPLVMLIIPDPTTLVDLARIAGEITRQLTLKVIEITAQSTAQQQEPQRILGTDEPA